MPRALARSFLLFFEQSSTFCSIIVLCYFHRFLLLLFSRRRRLWWGPSIYSTFECLLACYSNVLYLDFNLRGNKKKYRCDVDYIHELIGRWSMRHALNLEICSCIDVPRIHTYTEKADWQASTSKLKKKKEKRFFLIWFFIVILLFYDIYIRSFSSISRHSGSSSNGNERNGAKIVADCRIACSSSSISAEQMKCLWGDFFAHLASCVQENWL